MVTNYAHAQSRAILHFSYGANMCPRGLAKRGLTPLSSEPARVTDPGVILSFRHRGGFATLLLPPDAPQQRSTPATSPALQRAGPHGVLYSLTPEDMRTLQRAETGYKLVELQVTPYPSLKAPITGLSIATGASSSSCSSTRDGDAALVALPRQRITAQRAGPGSAADASAGEHSTASMARKLLASDTARKSESEEDCSTSTDGGGARPRSVTATAFVSRPMLQLRQAVPPTERYLQLLRQGARERGLGAGYSAWLHSVPSVRSSGLPAEYFDTPSGLVANAVLMSLVAASMVAVTMGRL